MIAELVAIFAIILLPAGLLLATLTALSLAVAGLAGADQLDERALLRS